MKTLNFLKIGIIWIGFVFVSCNNGETTNPDGTKVIKEYYKNNVLKAEITVKDTLRHGVTKNYDKNGKLMSMANFVDNRKEGVAKNFYSTGSVQQEMFYKKDKLEGEAKMFYENGKVYLKTFYVNNKKHGLEQTFYENGKLQSEVEYLNGWAGTGLKEYNEQGVLLTKKPTIEVREINPPFNNKLILEISLSDKNRNVKFYLDTLLMGKYLHKYIYIQSVHSNKGIGSVEYIKSKTIQLKKLNIVAEITTPRKNKLVIQRTYNLVIK
jgi:antitoxin component YwqK of YwqJK toxin-antitoxin module